MYTPMKYMRFMICNERKERHMFNEITIGPLTLHTYGLMIGLGFLAAYAMCYYRGKKMKMETLSNVKKEQECGHGNIRTAKKERLLIRS